MYVYVKPIFNRVQLVLHLTSKDYNLTMILTQVITKHLPFSVLAFVAALSELCNTDTQLPTFVKDVPFMYPHRKVLSSKSHTKLLSVKEKRKIT